MSREQLFICAMETREKQLLAQLLYKNNGNYIRVYMSIRGCICMYIYSYLYSSVYSNIYIYISIHMCIYIYMYI
jgi:hypothetical protein